MTKRGEYRRYDRSEDVCLRLPPGGRERLKQAAKAAEFKSVNEYLLWLIESEEHRIEWRAK